MLEFNKKILRDAEELIEFFRIRNISDKGINDVFDVLIDIGDLNGKAMVTVLEQVKDFLNERLPEPTENGVINRTVIEVMGIIIDDLRKPLHSPS